MINPSLLLPPLALALTASPAFWIRRQDRNLRPLFATPNFLNYLVVDRRDNSAMQCTLLAGAAVSVAWMVFAALGATFMTAHGGTLA